MEFLSTEEYWGKIFSAKSPGEVKRKPEKKLVLAVILGTWQKFMAFLPKLRPLTGRDEEEARSKKTLLTISIILVLLLTLSIFFNLKERKTVSSRQQLEQVLDLVSHQYEEAVGLIDLNPIRARELLSAAKISLAPLLSLFPKKGEEQKRIREWLDKISTQEVTAYKIYRLTTVPLFFDLTLLKPGGEGEKIEAYKEGKAILDGKNKVIYFFSTKTKEAEIVAGPEVVGEAKSLTIHGSYIYLLTAEGISRIEIKSKESKIVIKKDEKWGEIGGISSFGGNLYLLDKKAQTIWKYIATEAGFSPRTTYLNPDVRVNFATATKMVIDGSVWVVVAGEILKFTRGLGEPFAFKGLGDTIEEIEDISTSDTSRRLYVLEKNMQRILVFEKDGSYHSQYQWEELKNASSFIASEEEKKIFVMIGSKIYAIDIK